MLPLAQMHQMVHSAPHFDASLPFHRLSQHQQHPHQQPQQPHHPRATNKHGLLSSSHRAFPIRASQPPQPLHLSHPSDQHENYLRRKTPNGTIDAGYDGTPARLASGPPPLKHMILPGGVGALSSTPAVTNEYTVSGQGNWPFWGPSAGDAVEPRAFDSFDASMLLRGSAAWPYGLDRGLRPGVALDCAPNAPSTAYYPYNNALRVPTVVQPAYHQSPGPTIFNNGGLAPPPAWPEMNTQGLEPTAFGIPSLHAMNRQPMHSVVAPAASLGRDPRYEIVQGNIQVPAQRMESLTLDAGRYDLGGAPLTAEASSPARFREKALANAHRTYVDLLAFLHSSRKAASGRTSNGSRPPSKMVIFPKLPNPPKHRASGLRRRQMHDYGTSMSHSAASPSYMLHGQVEMADMSPMPLGGTRHHLTGNCDMPAGMPYYHPNSEGLRLNPPNMSRPVLTRTPISSAKDAAEMLHHLCEQSGWKWVDGMLLGGCLYYGLEKYELALDWFLRIVALDERWVTDAITFSNHLLDARRLFCANCRVIATSRLFQTLRLHYIASSAMVRPRNTGTKLSGKSQITWTPLSILSGCSVLDREAERL
jgi:hypothetical protein